MKKNILTGLACLASGVLLGYTAKKYDEKLQALAGVVRSRITALFSSKSTTVNNESEEPSASVEEK